MGRKFRSENALDLSVLPQEFQAPSHHDPTPARRPTVLRGAGRTKERFEQTGNAAAPTSDSGAKNCACAPKARAPPPVFKPGGGKGDSALAKSAPAAPKGRHPLEPSLPHTHPLPAGPQDPRGANGPQAPSRSLSRHPAQRDQSRLRGSGAGRTGLVHMTPSEQGVVVMK